MFHAKTRIRHYLTAFAALFAICGCNGDETPPTVEQAPFEGLELKIAVPAGDDLKTRWRIELDEWSARTGARHQLQEYDATTADSQKPSALGEAALILLPITAVATREFAPLTEEMQSSQNMRFIDLFSGLRTDLASFGGKPSLLPISTPVLVYAYRRDILNQAKLSPPTTWEEHLQLVQDLDAIDHAVVEPWGEDSRVTMFLARAVTYAKHPHQYSLFFDVNSGEPLIDGPGFVRALEESRPALQSMKKRNDVTSLTPTDCRKMLLDGKVAVAITLATDADALAMEDDATAKRPESAEIAFVRLPGHATAFNHSTGEWESVRDHPVNLCTLTAFNGLAAGVSPHATELEQRAAWDFLAQLTVEPRKLMQVFPAHSRSLCRESQLALPSAFVSEEFSAPEAEQVAQAVAESLRGPQIVADLPVVGRKRFRAALSSGIERFLNEEIPADEALQQVAAEWRKIKAEIGEETLLNSYRRSVGLRTRKLPSR